MLLAASTINWEALYPYLKEHDLKSLKARNNGKLDYKLLREVLGTSNIDIYEHLIVTLMFNTDSCEDLLILATRQAIQYNRMLDSCILSLPLTKVAELLYSILRHESLASGILREQAIEIMRGITEIDNQLLKKYYYRNGNLYEHNTNRQGTNEGRR